MRIPRYKFTFKITNVSKVKIFFLTATVIGVFSLIGCSKSNSSTSTKDSVYYSPWLTITMAPTDAGDTAFTGTISASSITASVVRGGAVMTYLGSPGFPSAGDTAAESAVDYGLYSSFVLGSIDLLSFGYGNDFSTSNSGFVFRYVVIPGTILETTGLTRQQLSKMNYTEVTNLLHPASRQAPSPSLSTQ